MKIYSENQTDFYCEPYQVCFKGDNHQREYAYFYVKAGHKNSKCQHESVERLFKRLNPDKMIVSVSYV